MVSSKLYDSMLYLRVKNITSKDLLFFVNKKNEIFDRAVHGILLEPITYYKVGLNDFIMCMPVNCYLYSFPLANWFPKILVYTALRISIKFQARIKCSMRITSNEFVAGWFVNEYERRFEKD